MQTPLQSLQQCFEAEQARQSAAFKTMDDELTRLRLRFVDIGPLCIAISALRDADRKIAETIQQAQGLRLTEAIGLERRRALAAATTPQVN